jgi:hypothetical protein
LTTVARVVSVEERRGCEIGGIKTDLWGVTEIGSAGDANWNDGKVAVGETDSLPPLTIPKRDSHTAERTERP